MSPLARSTGVAELLDRPDQDPGQLHASLTHVAQVNRWLGGTRALLLALGPHWRDGLRILDVGTGSGDLPIAIAQHARARGMRVEITAAEPHPQTRALAIERTAAFPEIRVAAGDACALPWSRDTFDVVLFSLMLHHLEDDAARTALREAARVAPLVIVNELHRTRSHYAGARVLGATLWRRNPITRHDGPLSVRRAYRPSELGALATGAGLRVLEVRRRWFYRVVLTAVRP